MTFTGSVTVQNLEVFPISVNLYSASGSSLAGNVLLNPRASKSWSAGDLGVADGGGGVIATASWSGDAISSDARI